MTISQKDRARLREVARLCAELASSPRNQQMYSDWAKQGASRTGVRPFVRIEITSFEQDVLPSMLQCEGREARAMEAAMLRPVANFTLFEDDTMVPAYYGVTEKASFIPFGLEVKRQLTDGVGHHFIPYLHQLEEDDHLLGPSLYKVDKSACEAEMQIAGDLFGDILPVKRISDAAYCTPMQDIVHIMNMDDMYIAMLDE